MSEPRTEAVRQLRERHYRVVPTDPKILHPYCPGCLQDWDPEGCDTARALALLDQERASLEMCPDDECVRLHWHVALAAHREAQPERSKNDA